ncbi:hypothetical protein [Microcoleus sp. PH2017_16_JOR_D_A]|uniref:hypothetical protein n=1 Tax=Microcoleus sp. PH2017_16_JOR_D_A TaxID=2798827 RepID=UPI0025E10D71|nr:hypothetical protein [Microcoleus sp. PH2017_16_JOR_D_A]
MIPETPALITSSFCQLSTVNCQLSIVNCQLSTVNCQLSILPSFGSAIASGVAVL